MMRSVRFILLTLLLAGLFQAQGVQAQNSPFDSTSNGSDGALNLTTPGTILFDPRSFTPPLDQDGDNIYHFTTINIAAGVTVRLSGQVISGPVYWLASGAVKIDGVIDLNGETSLDARSYINNGSRFPTPAGAGGYPGGIGHYLNSSSQPGSGPGGGLAGVGEEWGGGAGYAISGRHRLHGGATYGNAFIVPLIGGSGGGGNFHYPNFTSSFGGGGGGGGGAILIASSVGITINGSITTNGGFTSVGGGGSGGAIRLATPMISGAGQLTAIGSGNELSSYGRIRIEAFQHNFSGTINPAPSRAAPFQLFLPATPPPTVRVIDIGGSSVNDKPTNNFIAPDVTVSTATTTTLTIEARYVPLGTRVTLVIIPENSQDQLYTSTPLVGAFERSTATVAATIPSGFARIYVRTKWTP